jgi:glutathione S-transferase
MKLFYSPGACSLSPHIVLRETGLEAELVKVDLRAHTTADGTDFYTLNPKGYVPVLELDSGERLTEGPAIVQYLADQKPAAGLAPAAGTLPRYRLQEWLNYLSTEIHKSFSPLFNPKTLPEVREAALASFKPRLEFLSRSLEGRGHLMGPHFSVADAYLFTLLNWAGFVKLDLGPYPLLKAYQARVAARPAVQAALRAEGLIK